MVILYPVFLVTHLYSNEIKDNLVVIITLVPPLAIIAVIHKNEEDFSGVSLQIHIHRVQSDVFFTRTRYLSVNGYFESEEKDSGLPSNRQKFGLV